MKSQDPDDLIEREEARSPAEILGLIAQGWTVIESDGTVMTLQGHEDDPGEIVVDTAALRRRSALPVLTETPCGLEVTDRKSQWMLENSEGRWLHNAENGTFTSDPNLGLKWPNRSAADAFRLGLRGPLWALKLTEHVWIEPEPTDPTLSDQLAGDRSEAVTTYRVTNRQIRALSLYEAASGASVSGGTTSDAMRRLHDAETWLAALATPATGG